MKRFIITILLFLIPAVLIVGVYIITDPFKICRDHEEYLSDYVMLNRGYVSTRVFLKNRGSYDYDSFIFGSSRSTAFPAIVWQRYLPSGSLAYSFGSWNETIEGIYRKVVFLDRNNVTIRNALVIFDTDYTFQNSISSLKFEHRYISGLSWLNFQTTYIKQYFQNPYLIPASVDYMIFKKQRAYMKGFIGQTTADLDRINNDWYIHSEDEIVEDSVSYYSRAKAAFYERPGTQQYDDPQIDNEELNMMLELDSLFKVHNTNLTIVISPLYDQKKFSPEDIRLLDSVFGEQNIHDLSGINDITDNMYNYANDVMHYRKRTGSRILNEIYNHSE